MICDQTGREVRDELAELKAENKRMRLALAAIYSYARLSPMMKLIAREAMEGIMK
jgi:hypothetical protein